MPDVPDDKKRSIFRNLVKLCPPVFRRAQEEAPDKRPLVPCSPEEVVSPDTFRSPEAVPLRTRKLVVIPSPLVFENASVTLTCEEVENVGPVGTSGIAAEGEFLEIFHFQSIPGIPSDRLTYISTLSTEERAEFLEEIELDRIRELTKLDVAFAEILQDALADVRQSVASKALAAATARIDCFWENQETEVACEDEDALLTDATLGTINPFTVGEGSFVSRVSQEDANNQATAYGEVNLICLFANAEQVVACDDTLDEDFPLQSGFPTSIPVDSSLVGAATELRVGQVTLAAGSLLSTEDQADADALAQAQARSGLVCFYLNEETSLDCEDVDKTGTIESPSTDLEGPGNPIAVRAGVFTSTTDQAAADTAAEAYALSLLQCLWASEEITVTCPNVTVREGLPGEAEVEPNEEKSPVFTFTAPLGFYVSSESQTDADETAELLANNQLDCVYCNPEIAPVCVPDDVYEAGVTELPLDVSVIESWWSADATRGVPAGLFCDADPLTAVILAESLANTPITQAPESEDNCTYESDEVSAACVADPSLDLLGTFSADTSEERNALRAALSRNSFPDPLAEDAGERFITWSKGRISVAEGDIPEDFGLSIEPAAARGKAYANFLAEKGILSDLNCFYENSERHYLCDGGILNGVYNPELVEAGEETIALPVYQVRSFNSGASIFAGFYRKQESGLWTNGTTWLANVDGDGWFFYSESEAELGVEGVRQLQAPDVFSLEVGDQAYIDQTSDIPIETIATAELGISDILIENAEGDELLDAFAGTYYRSNQQLAPDDSPLFVKGDLKIWKDEDGALKLYDGEVEGAPIFSGSSGVFFSTTLQPPATIGEVAFIAPRQEFTVELNEDASTYLPFSSALFSGTFTPVEDSDSWSNGVLFWRAPESASIRGGFSRSLAGEIEVFSNYEVDDFYAQLELPPADVLHFLHVDSVEPQEPTTFSPGATPSTAGPSDTPSTGGSSVDGDATPVAVGLAVPFIGNAMFHFIPVDEESVYGGTWYATHYNNAEERVLTNRARYASVGSDNTYEFFTSLDHAISNESEDLQYVSLSSFDDLVALKDRNPIVSPDDLDTPVGWFSLSLGLEVSSTHPLIPETHAGIYSKIAVENSTILSFKNASDQTVNVVFTTLTNNSVEVFVDGRSYGGSIDFEPTIPDENTITITVSPETVTLGPASFNNGSFEVVVTDGVSFDLYTDMAGTWSKYSASIWTNRKKWFFSGDEEDAAGFYDTLGEASSPGSNSPFAAPVADFLLSSTEVDITASRALEEVATVRRSSDDLIVSDEIKIYGTGIIDYKAAEGSAEVSPEVSGSRINPVIIPAGMFSSPTNPEALDAQILTFVRGALRCGWFNEEMIVRCGATIPTTNVFSLRGGLKGPNFDTNGGYWHVDSSGHKAVSPIGLDSGQHFSEESPGHANLAALMLGYGQLDCFYRATAVSYSDCEILEPEAAGIDSILWERIGEPSEAVATSKISQADAQAQAASMARSMVSCQWTNNATQPEPCPSGTVTAKMPEGCYDYLTGTVVEGCREPGIEFSEINSTKATRQLVESLNAERLCLGPDDVDALSAALDVTGLCPLELYYTGLDGAVLSGPAASPSGISMVPGSFTAGITERSLGPSDVAGLSLPSGAKKDVVLKITVNPGSTAYDAGGVTQYHVLGINTLVSHQIKYYADEAPVRAVVNSSTGAVVTQGIYFIKIGWTERVGGIYQIGNYRCGPIVITLGANGELWVQSN